VGRRTKDKIPDSGLRFTTRFFVSLFSRRSERRTLLLHLGVKIQFTMKKIDCSCLLAAILLVASNILFFISIFQFQKRGDFDFESWKQLDPAVIQDEWKFRDGQLPLELSSAILNVVAWLALSVPILQLAWILSDGGARLLATHVLIGVLALAGTIIESVAALFLIGTTFTTSWLASDFNLGNWTGTDSNDQIGWRTLEVTYIAIQGMRLWVDALEFLALFGILLSVFVSVRAQETRLFGSCWSWLGVVIAALCIVDFAADILRFQSWRVFSSVALGISVVNQLLLLPLWLVMLGAQLPRAKDSLTKTHITSSSIATPSGEVDGSSQIT